MKVTLSTPLPATEVAARLKEAFRLERRGIWGWGAKWRVLGSVSGNRFRLRGYIGNPYGLYLFSLEGTFVQTNTGTLVDGQYGTHMGYGTLPAVGVLVTLLVLAGVVAPFFGLPQVLVVGVGATLFTALMRLGPPLMWRIWKSELLGFLRDSIDARVVTEQTAREQAS